MVRCKGFYDKYIIYILLIILVVFIITSCSWKSGDNDSNSLNQRRTFTYSSRVVDFYSDSFSTQIFNIIPYGGCYYAIVRQVPHDGSSATTHLYCVDENGVKQSDADIDNNMNIYVSSYIANDMLIYVTFSGELEKADINSGEILYSEQVGDNLCGVSPCEDGYVVMSIGKIEKYDNNDNQIGSIENPEWQFFNGYRTFFENDGEYYLLSDTQPGNCWKYYSLSFESSDSEMIYDPINNEEIKQCSGKYIFDEKGESFINIDDLSVFALAKWSDMNLQPPRYAFADPVYIGIDNNSFIQIYNYPNGMAQMVIYTYEEGIDYGDRDTITIGGYGCQYDLALNWAIYSYNTSQSDYRVIIEDYNEQFGWESLEESVSQTAALIAYFNEGNAPDIYYGNYFDYSSFEENGELLDITQYMSDGFNARFNDITPNIRNLMTNTDGSCYRIFSGYQIEGYISSYDIGDNVTIDDVIQSAEQNDITIYPGILSMDIADQVICYSSFEDGLCTVEELERILEYSFEYGVYDLSYSTYIQMDRSTVNDYLLWNTNIYNVLRLDEIVKNCNESFVFVGYPNLSESKRLIIPFGQVAISSSTPHPQECCQVISYLLDEETQDANNFSCIIPVNDKSLHKMVDYASDHSSIPEEDYAYALYLNPYDEITEETAVMFYTFVDGVNTIQFYDRGILSIVYEEVQQYYTQNKPVDMIANSLRSRLSIYMEE